MPRKPATTREEMIEGAFQLVRREGHEAFTARNIAKELGCSTQPLMYRFPSLSELKELVYARADQFHTAYILDAPDFLHTGLRYIQFAKEETPLFRFLFQSGHFRGLALGDMVRDPGVSPVVNAAAAELGIPEQELFTVFETLYVTVHGYADLIANNAMEYDPADMEKNLMRIAEGMLGKEG
ncbi:MAG: hypothetical protein K6G61_00315 [Solobacterium sp.]|nr:hypothetical protein [Solobacterium sp.]